MATSSRPQYIAWVSTVGIDFSPQPRKPFEINVQGAQNAVQNSAFVQGSPSFIETQGTPAMISSTMHYQELVVTRRTL